MKKLLWTLMALTVLSVPAVAIAEQECAFIWREADLNRDGRLSVMEEIRYLAMLRIANKTMVADGTFADRLFQEGCKTNRLATAGLDLKVNRLEFQQP